MDTSTSGVPLVRVDSLPSVEQIYEEDENNLNISRLPSTFGYPLSNITYTDALTNQFDEENDRDLNISSIPLVTCALFPSS